MQELIVVLGLMIPFLGILLPVLVLLLVQVGHRQLPQAEPGMPEDAPGAEVGDEAPAFAVAPAAATAVPPAPAELAWLCEQLRESDVF